MLSNSSVPDIVGEYPVRGPLRVGAAEIILAEVGHVKERSAKPRRQALLTDLKSSRFVNGSCNTICYDTLRG